MVEADIIQGELDPDLRAALNVIVEELIDEVSLGLCFEIHRSCKVGSLFLNGFDETSDTEYAIVDRPGVDVLGQIPSKKNYECVCPNCQRHLAASRFAPHLEKCMGMGRNSYRIARRRIANNQKQGSDESGQDDENDNDWNYTPESKRLKRLKKDKATNSPRKRRLAKLRNGRTNQDLVPLSTETIESSETAQAYEAMTLEDKKALLLNSCGVVSENTKKMCTRTGKCAQHTDEQRRKVRKLLLRQSHAHDMEDIHIDIDTYDDAESQSLRESLQWEACSNSSPTDSTSTNNSGTGIVILAAATAAAAVAPPPGNIAVAGSLKRSSKNPGKISRNKKQKIGKQSVSSSSSASSSNKDQGSANLYDFN